MTQKITKKKTTKKSEDNISGFDSSIEKLSMGINKVADLLRKTYGPYGSNILIEESLYPYHSVRNDGKLIVDSIRLEDSVEQMGVNILKEACDKQEKECGDGRKTTVLLTTALLNEGIILMKKEHRRGIEIKRELDECLEKIIEKIDLKKVPISVKDIGSIATAASESPEIGRIVQEAYETIGNGGIIEIEPSSLPGSFYEVVGGIRIRGAKMWSGWMTNGESCTIENPKILIVRDKITSISQLEPIYEKCVNDKIDTIVLYFEDIEVSLAARLALSTEASLQGNPKKVKTLMIKAPTLWKDWIYEDLEHLTGAKSVSMKDGRTFSSFETSWLGTCSKWIATKEESKLQGTKNVDEYVAILQEKGKTDDQQLVRASWLNTKTAILKMGAQTESELSWKIRKARDAAHASYYALREGVVEGGGKTLSSIKTGNDIIDNALKEPWRQIVLNGGKLGKGDIFDPAIVVKSAVRTSISLAGIILTSAGAITIPQLLKDEVREMNKRSNPYGI